MRKTEHAHAELVSMLIGHTPTLLPIAVGALSLVTAVVCPPGFVASGGGSLLEQSEIAGVLSEPSDRIIRSGLIDRLVANPAQLMLQ
jgi:hypothetical protein